MSGLILAYGSYGGSSLDNGQPELMVKRALFLFAIGLLNQIIIPADILHYYGVYFLSPIPRPALYPRGHRHLNGHDRHTLMATPLLTRLNIATWLATPGRQILTLYVAHILIGMGILEAIGRLDGSRSPPAIFTIAIAFATLTSLYARLWLRINHRGPLEALMRKITEGQAK